MFISARRLSKLVFLSLTCYSVLGAAAESDDLPFQSDAALEAKNDYDVQLRKAEDEYLKDIIRISKRYLERLTKAHKAAVKDGDLEEGNRTKVVLDQLTQKIENLQTDLEAPSRNIPQVSSVFTSKIVGKWKHPDGVLSFYETGVAMSDYDKAATRKWRHLKGNQYQYVGPLGDTTVEISEDGTTMHFGKGNIDAVRISTKP